VADTINVKFKVMEDGSLQAIGKDADKAGAALDKATKSSERYSKRNKGVAGATSNSTKAFSKMTTGIEGGLVPAYATLAAHVFAVTAAFGVLQRNAGIAQLNEGIIFTGRAAGQNLPLVAEGLRQITDLAISTTDAMKAVAIGTSAGFSESQLKGLTTVAKGASLALGRDMTDALDRLVRGAAKLEPEILDELGIMVRLDETANKYAASINKTAGELTVFEKRMAFTNAIIEQGTVKFGALNSVIEANPYSKLAAQFDDMLKGLLNGLNFLAGPIIGVIASNMGLLVGAMGVFSGSVVKMMVPALTQSGIAAAEHATEIKDQAKAQIANSKVFSGAPKVYKGLVASLKNGTATTEQMNKAQASLNKSIDIHTKQMPAYIKKHREGSDAVKLKQKKLDDAIASLKGLTQAQTLETQATIQSTRADVLNAAATGSLKDTYVALTASIAVETAATRASTASKGMLATAMAWVSTSFSIATFSVKAFSIALINAIPVIGQIVFLASLAFMALKKLFTSPPTKLQEATEAALEAMKEWPNIIEQMVTTYSMVNTAAERFEVSLAAQSGLLQQVTDKMMEQISIQKSMAMVEKGKAKAQVAMAKVQVQQQEKGGAQVMGFWEKLLKLSAAGNVHSGPGGAALMMEVIASDRLKQSVEDLSKAKTKLAEVEAKPVVDEAAARETQITVLAKAITMQEMFIATQKAGSDESKLAQRSHTGLLEIFNKLTSGEMSATEAAKATEVLNNEMKVTKNAADAAAESLRSVTEIAAKSSSTTGVFADSIDALTLNLQNLGKEGEKFAIIGSKYEEAFEKMTGSGTKEAAEKLLANMQAVNTAKKQEAMIDAERANRAQQLETAGLGLVAAQFAHTNAIEDTAAAELALQTTMDNKLSTEEEKYAAIVTHLKAINAEEKERLRLIDARTDSATRLGGDMFGAGEAGAGHMEKNAATLDDSSTPASDKIKILGDSLGPMMEQAKKLGPEGELIASVTAGTMVMAESFTAGFEKMKEGTFGLKDGIGMAASAVSALGSMQAAKSKAAIAGVDKEIAAEKARDGKSKASLAKIAAMEKKKENMKRKAFEQNKKMQMAQVVMSTANAIMSAVQGPPGLPWSAAFGAMAAAMGMAQLSAISSTSFQGGSSSAPSAPSKVSIGERKNTVDLAKANNASGELAYSRGAMGQGTGMTDYKPAFTGSKYRGAGGYVVGEQGPELFMPDVPGEILSAGVTEDVANNAPVNVNFTIQAIDSQDMEQALNIQRGNIIGMIREAANANGDFFLEGVE